MDARARERGERERDRERGYRAHLEQPAAPTLYNEATTPTHNMDANLFSNGTWESRGSGLSKV